MTLLEIKYMINTTIQYILKYFRRFQLYRTDFTIISNNCWGGFIYQYYGLPYKSPTIGLGIEDEHYMKFINNLKYYMSQSLEFIDPKTSTFYETRKIRNGGKDFIYPVAKLGDIEIYFSHYRDKESALKKWEKRRLQINWNCIIYKWSQRNGADDNIIKRFIQIEGNKIAFVSPDTSINHACLIKIPEFLTLKHAGGDETHVTLQHMKITTYLNKILKKI